MTDTSLVNGNTRTQPQGRLVCAWCGQDLGPAGTVETSHGICERCAREQFGKYLKSKEERDGR